MIARFKSKAQRAARKAALFSGGLLLCAVGAVFMTIAAWIYLNALFSALQAALILGGLYLGVGLILIGISRGANAETARPHAQTATATPETQHPDAPPLIQAFLYGLEAGARARR